MESTREHPDVVNSYLEKEREDGWIVGPLNFRRLELVDSELSPRSSQALGASF